jgi:hypothetical protein
MRIESPSLPRLVLHVKLQLCVVSSLNSIVGEINTMIHLVYEMISISSGGHHQTQAAYPIESANIESSFQSDSSEVCRTRPHSKFDRSSTRLSRPISLQNSLTRATSVEPIPAKLVMRANKILRILFTQFRRYTQ